MSWQGRRALVTGAAGFIATIWPSVWLEREPRRGPWCHTTPWGAGLVGWLAVKGRDGVPAGDICDRDRVRAAMNGVDMVFHLATLIAISLFLSGLELLPAHQR